MTPEEITSYNAAKVREVSSFIDGFILGISTAVLVFVLIKVGLL